MALAAGRRMDGIEKYVTELNISLFIDLLEEEHDGARRSHLKKLLLAEEDRFARMAERLQVAENCLVKCAQRVNELRVRVDGMTPDHPHRAVAQRVLENLLDIEAVVQDHKNRLKNLLN